MILLIFELNNFSMHCWQPHYFWHLQNSKDFTSITIKSTLIFDDDQDQRDKKYKSAGQHAQASKHLLNNPWSKQIRFLKNEKTIDNSTFVGTLMQIDLCSTFTNINVYISLEDRLLWVTEACQFKFWREQVVKFFTSDFKDSQPTFNSLQSYFKRSWIQTGIYGRDRKVMLTS